MKKTVLPLAVFCPGLGHRSETFIHKHVNELYPGKTLAVSCLNFTGDWSTTQPTHNLCPPRRQNLLQAFKSRVYHYIGYSPDLNALKRSLKKYGVQVIMSEFLDWSVQWIDVANELGIRFFAHAHGTDINVRLREEQWRREYLKYNQTNGIITISEFSKRQLIAAGIREEIIRVVPCGTEPLEHFTPRELRDKITCISVGRMIPCKSPVYTIDAFRRAAEKDSRLDFTYIGAGPYLQAAQQLVHAFQMHDKIHVTGGLPHQQVLELLQQADIYIQHSVEDTENGMAEGLPVSILEAMGHGLPVVATRLTGIPEAVEDGVTGFLVEPGDSAAMAECILRLASDSALRHRMGRAGWERVRDLFSWEIERKKLLDILGLN
ncbi:MAG: glycosyltransferase family 4 protein [Chitinophagales bacterium]|nr:glycosyltransferase family 4 protein [Chitinophagales bacterium]MDW8418240.1 glycosyltransferase family 4 protein [Chitinophagales bacterium]